MRQEDQSSSQAFDWERVTASKQALRRELAALPLEEKLRLLDALRERAVTLNPGLEPFGVDPEAYRPDVESVEE